MRKQLARVGVNIQRNSLMRGVSVCISCVFTCRIQAYKLLSGHAAEHQQRIPMNSTSARCFVLFFPACMVMMMMWSVNAGCVFRVYTSMLCVCVGQDTSEQ